LGGKIDEFGVALAAIAKEVKELQVWPSLPVSTSSGQVGSKKGYINISSADRVPVMPISAINFAANTVETETDTAVGKYQSTSARKWVSMFYSITARNQHQ